MKTLDKELNGREYNMKKDELLTISPLTLAYLGDTVYESFIREHLIKQNCNKKVNDLHKTAIKYVKAKAQATIIHNLIDELYEDEVRIYKKGRNQKSHTSAKNADIVDYKCATGFEALIGYVYLLEDYDRLNFLIKKSIEIIESSL